jgi:uncharacterized protein YfaS (alpha-2-macroglobulin family)
MPMPDNPLQRLLADGKLEQAFHQAEASRKTAEAQGDDASLARALVQAGQLRVWREGYESAIRFLKETPWPQSPAQYAVVGMFYAEVLLKYAKNAWMLGDREDVVSSTDVGAWSRQQFIGEACRSHAALWRMRDKWGSEPITRVGEYLGDSDYPPGIRDTLRDAASYLVVELLANQHCWRPEQVKEIGSLDAVALAGGVAKASSEVALDDETAHPMVKIGAVLADLEQWHLEAGRRESALEARLERARRLHEAFTMPEDRAAVRANLEKRLVEDKELSWWSMGVGLLAELMQAADDVRDPSLLIRARALAETGMQEAPFSHGGRHCSKIMQRLESPSLELASMLSDLPGRPSLMVTYKNLDAVWFRAYLIDVEDCLRTRRKYDPLPGSEEIGSVILDRAPSQAWRVDLPPTPDLRRHRTFVALPAAMERGHYLVVAARSENFRREAKAMIATYVGVTDLVLLRRSLGRKVELTVMSGTSGRPIADARVALWTDVDRSEHRYKCQKTAKTASDGRLILASRFTRHLIVVKHDRDLLFDRGQWSGAFDDDRVPSVSLVYTDRSIYRPTQTVRWKVVVARPTLRGETGTRFRTIARTRLTVQLLDANGQIVEKKRVSTNALGTAAGEFTIPAGRMLGAWKIVARPRIFWHVFGAEEQPATIRVEEYKRPTFEVTWKDSVEPRRLNQTASVEGEARYYFGLPVTNGSVRWNVRRARMRTTWHLWGPWGLTTAEVPTEPEGEVIGAGTVTVEDDGSFRFSFTPKADEREARGSTPVAYCYTVQAFVTDAGGETRSATRDFRLGFVSVQAAIVAKQAFFLADSDVELTVARKSLDNEPRPGEGKWRLFSLRQPTTTPLPAEISLLPPGGEPPSADDVVTPGDRVRPRFAHDYSAEMALATWEDGREEAAGAVIHDGQGEGRIALGRLAAGAYRLHYESTDAGDARVSATKEFVVAADRTPLALPGVLWAEHSSVAVGQTLRLLACSGLAEQYMTFELFQSGKRIERRVLWSGQGADLQQIPIEERHRGGVEVVLSLLRDHQIVQLRQTVMVPWDDKKLKLELATFRDRVRPGAHELWRLKVRTSDGRIPELGAAEVLAYIYDRSLDLLAPHTPPDPLALYRMRARAGKGTASLGSGPTVWSVVERLPELARLRPARLLVAPDQYGVGNAGDATGSFMARGIPVMSAQVRSRSAGLGSLLSPIGSLLSPKGGDRSWSAEEAPAPASAAPHAAGDGPATPPVFLRSDFAETALFAPQLRLDEDGAVAIEVTFPDSVTAWKVWAHAITRDLHSGSVSAEIRTVQDLMVRPYPPRFLREGDAIDLQVMINNAGTSDLAGNLTVDILDLETDKSVAAAFSLAGANGFHVVAGGSVSLTFSMKAPRQVGALALRVTAVAGDTSDGELRPLPLLPSRMHLAQSRFATLKGQDRRVLAFPDMTSEDPSRVDERLVVTVEAQLFYNALAALPYLVWFPYECTEQTLNRFVSTAILTSLSGSYPAVARAAAELAKRDTPHESFDRDDANRKLPLEECPWLVEAQGGGDIGWHLRRVLNPRVAAANRRSALARLRKSQDKSGGFPWWPKGEPSTYLTLYILSGLARARDFGVEVPRDLVERGWAFLAEQQEWLRETGLTGRTPARHESEEDNRPHLAFLSYVLSCYPGESWTGSAFGSSLRQEIADHLLSDWQSLPRVLKGQLALALHRLGREEEARRVFGSVMGQAKTTADTGTFWSPEPRGWLWYHDAIEGHAFALRILGELDPSDSRCEGMVHWLLLNKKLNHWKSTRATAEVIFSLAAYLKSVGQLGVREAATVMVGSKRTELVFEPEHGGGRKSQIVIPGEAIDRRSMSEVTVAKATPGMLFASATWHFSTESLPEAASGDLFALTRSYFKRVVQGSKTVLEPLADGATLCPGDEVEVELALVARHPAEYVHLRDPRAAGFEPEHAQSGYRLDLRSRGVVYYEEIRDSATNFFFEALPQGEYRLRLRLRAAHAGIFRVGPATLQSMYAPDQVAYSAGSVIDIGQG